MCFMDIEVEVRSFLTKEKYEELLEYFKKNAQFLNDDYQETHYFDCEEDLRIQKNNFFSKIWMKKGKIHDEAREEIEIKVAKEDFEKLEKIFQATGLKVKIKWFRNRTNFKWQNITVSLDYTRGYGYIIELEIMSDEENKESSLKILREKLDELGIIQTSKEEFDKKFNDYKNNCEELTK